eukprot:TRINITY_DN7499_c0_g1_i1.p1 TRINITY_DN7499_c0_g1~~TRINITY_DN7499_c0_g1_i1.p1  ORF type:complete len:496 (+),score=51.86 TRINITY_DN7499_c0_g1_i1:78-1490(+)
MNNTNELISGDNKGYASYLFEKYMNGNTSLPGQGPFVAAFAQSNEGDVSPNTLGAFCPDGTPCGDTPHSICNGKTEGCRGQGPGGKDYFLSCQIIGTSQFGKGLALWQSANTTLQGGIGYVHQYVNMSAVQVQANFSISGLPVSTCIGAMGDAFAAGTTDGPGEFNFEQGTNSTSTNAYWNFIGQFLSEPSAAEKACQAPKPILLNTGGINFPAPWTPTILPLQIFKVGQLYIVGVPGEFTTMSGRRLRNTVRETLLANGAPQDAVVVIAGLSNSYSHYITTFEEYQVQRYEAASTLFGPHTLEAYQQLYASLAKALATNTTVPPGPTPPDLTNQTVSFQPDILYDIHPIDKPYGTVLQAPESSYSAGDVVTVSFVGGNPNNDYMTQKTYLTVELEDAGDWTVVAVDGDWETRFHWQSEFFLESIITIEWFIPTTVTSGTYRIRTFGYSRDIFGTVTPYTGTSPSFTVTQ